MIPTCNPVRAHELDGPLSICPRPPPSPSPGLTVGYVGASHIPDYKKDTHAEMLMSGSRAENGKGAEIVISDMSDLLKVIEFFAGEKTAGKSAPFDWPTVSAQAQNTAG